LFFDDSPRNRIRYGLIRVHADASNAVDGIPLKIYAGRYDAKIDALGDEFRIDVGGPATFPSRPRDGSKQRFRRAVELAD